MRIDGTARTPAGAARLLHPPHMLRSARETSDDEHG
jgi:hypothetical protein